MNEKEPLVSGYRFSELLGCLLLLNNPEIYYSPDSSNARFLDYLTSTILMNTEIFEHIFTSGLNI